MVDPKMEAMVQNQNLRIFLGFIISDTKKMIEEKTDRVIHRRETRSLDPETLEWLKEVLVRMENLRTVLGRETEGKFVNAGMDRFCKCPSHLQYLKSIDVSLLSDLLSVDPLRLHDALHRAEQEIGNQVREPHLYVGIRLNIRKFRG